MTKKGFVTLVGAGPGDPGLLTLAGQDAIMAADVVLYDRLVGGAILSLIPRAAVKIAVGKSKGRHSVPQAEINRLLIEHAGAGRNVVRLKGGDPYLFGRGAEEVETLREHGIPFLVVPGVTSAVAVPAYAGIPVTHRDHASSLHIVTGHGQDGQPARIDHDALVKAGGTLVFLMGFSALDEICAKLIAAGMPASTPAAVISYGTTPRQRRLVADVGTLAAKTEAAHLTPPAVTVIGHVCALTDRFDWTGYLPLWGKSFLAVSTMTTGGRLAAGIRRLGGGVDELACVRTEPLKLSAYFWESVADYDWIALTSPYGATQFFEDLLGHGIDIRRLGRTRFAAVGRRTAGIMAARGVIADYVPEEYNGESLGLGLAKCVRPGEKLLLFRAKDGSDELPDALGDANVPFDDIAAYRTLATDFDTGGVGEALRNGAYDAVCFTSASAVKTFADGVDEEILRNTVAVCIGKSTGRAAADAGLQAGVAPEATLEGMIEYIGKRWGKSHGHDSPAEETSEK